MDKQESIVITEEEHNTLENLDIEYESYEIITYVDHYKEYYTYIG